MSLENPLRQPAHPAIDEAMVERLVHAFYAQVRRDEVLAPIFASVIGENWDAHLVRMCDFWSSVMLMSGRYKGNPMAVHARLETVRPEHFARWLSLFTRTAEQVCPPDVAAIFAARARNIARSLELGMFFRPNAEA
jgi:hemoglobin